MFDSDHTQQELKGLFIANAIIISMFDSEHTHQKHKSLLICNTLIISMFDSDHTHQKRKSLLEGNIHHKYVWQWSYPSGTKELTHR